MNRIIFNIALGLLAAGARVFAQSLDEVEIVTTHVGGNIHQLEGRGGNIAVSAGDDGILIVDDQFAPLAEKIKAAVAGIQQGSIAFLLNTHHHGDHTGGNAIFAKESVIVAQTGVRDRLSMANNHDPDALPIITFDESLSIHFNGEEIRMVHFPHGHTDNDAVVFFTGSNVVHMGDLLFTDSFPSWYPNEGGDIRGYAENVGKLIEMIPVNAPIIAGHGRLATIEDVKAFHAMLVESIRIVQERIDGGMSEDEAKAAGLPEEVARFRSDFTSVEAWVGKVYRDLKE